MSRNLRPVKSQWGEASSVFIDSEGVEELLRTIFPAVDMVADARGEYIVIEVRNGGVLLDAIAALTGNDQIRIAKQLKDETKKDEADPFDGIEHLIHNLRNMVDSWRTMLHADTLSIWVD